MASAGLTKLLKGRQIATEVQGSKNLKAARTAIQDLMKP